MDKRKGLIAGGIAGVALLLLGVVIAVPLLIGVTFGGFLTMTSGAAGVLADEGSQEEGQCMAGGSYDATPVSASQQQYVRTMIGVAKGLDIDKRGQIIATMVMLQESGIQNYANNGENINGYDIGVAPGTSFWLDVAQKSLDMPHDAVGNDADSVGLYQQRASSGWANTAGFSARENPDEAVERLMDPEFGARGFFGGPGHISNQGLLDVDGWQDMELTVAAQQVQGSAFPDAYAKWEAQARSLVNANQDVEEREPPEGDEAGDSGAEDFSGVSTEGSAGTAECGGGDGGGGTTISATGTVKDVIEAGREQLGVDYSWGGGSLDGPSEGFGDGAGITGFDCSSLMRYMVYQGTGESYETPRTASEQFKATQGNTVARLGDGEEKVMQKLQAGDLLFYGDSPSGIYHVAMYIGNGKMIEAPRTGLDVQIVDARVTNTFYAATRIDFEENG